MRERKVKKMFSNIYLHEQFEYDGFVIVPLADENEIVELQKMAAGQKPYSQWQGLIKQLTDEVFFEIQLLYAELKPVNATSDKGQVLQHATFVDESRYASAHVFCPLNADVTFNVFKASHTFIKNIRAERDALSAPYTNVSAVIPSYLQQVVVKAGYALIYHHGLIHTPAFAEKKLDCLQFGVAPAEAETYFYKANSATELEKFLSEPLANEWGIEMVKAKSLGLVKVEDKKLNAQELEFFVNPEIKKGIKEKISQRIIELLS